MYAAFLIELVSHAREHNQDMRFGQLLFNALSLHDKANYTDEYDSNFHQRLFYIEDAELATAISEWYKFVETYKNPGQGLLSEPSDNKVEG